MEHFLQPRCERNFQVHNSNILTLDLQLKYFPMESCLASITILPHSPPSCVTCSAGSRGFAEKRQKGGSRLRLTCVALAEDSHGLSAHAMHGERVVLWHLRRRVLLPRGAQGGQLLAEAEPYLRNTVEGQGRCNTSDVTTLGSDIY